MQREENWVQFRQHFRQYFLFALPVRSRGGYFFEINFTAALVTNSLAHPRNCERKRLTGGVRYACTLYINLHSGYSGTEQPYFIPCRFLKKEKSRLLNLINLIKLVYQAGTLDSQRFQKKCVGRSYKWRRAIL